MAREPALCERALRLLARREHTRTELMRKLAVHAAPGEDLEALLEGLVRRNLLSEQRYAESRVRLLSAKYGAARIAHELRAKGLSKESAEAAASTARQSETERAREVCRRKFRTAPATREERARQMRFLQSRGFSFEVIYQVLSEVLDDK